MNKKGLIIFALILIFALTLPGCNKAPAEEHFAGLKAKGEKFVADYNGAIQKLNAESSYSYTAIFYSETLTNFDAENKKLPEKEEWRKVNKEILYIKNGGEEYIKVASGPEVLELWLSGGEVTLAKVNGAVADREAYNPEVYKIAFPSDDPAALFGGAERKWFSETIKTAQFYNVCDIGEARLPYTLSPYTSGYGEDLSFDWQNIISVDILSIGLTLKKGRLAKLELYTEKISANKKEAFQIRSNQTAISYQGNRTGATKTVIEFSYPKGDGGIAIPR